MPNFSECGSLQVVSCTKKEQEHLLLFSVELSSQCYVAHQIISLLDSNRYISPKTNQVINIGNVREDNLLTLLHYSDRIFI